MGYMKSPSSLLQASTRFENWILSADIRADQMELRRARLLLWANLLGSPFGIMLLLLAFFVYPSENNGAIIMVIGYILTTCSLVSLRWFSSTRWPSMICSIGLTILIGLAILLGGACNCDDDEVIPIRECNLRTVCGATESFRNGQ